MDRRRSGSEELEQPVVPPARVPNDCMVSASAMRHCIVVTAFRWLCYFCFCGLVDVPDVELFTAVAQTHRFSQETWVSGT